MRQYSQISLQCLNLFSHVIATKFVTDPVQNTTTSIPTTLTQRLFSEELNYTTVEWSSNEGKVEPEEITEASLEPIQQNRTSASSTTAEFYNTTEPFTQSMSDTPVIK